MTDFDPDKAAELRESYINDLSGALSVATARIGERLGLYKVLAAAGQGGLTAEELSEKTGFNLRMLLEWLLHQAGGKYINYRAGEKRWYLTPEQAALLGDDDGPAFILGLHQMVTGMVKAEERIAEIFNHDGGLAWGDQDTDVHHGCGRFFRKTYENKLISEWIPKIDGLAERLEKGIILADVGCGLGYSTVEMAQAFPNSKFIGFDAHKPSMDFATALAAERGLGDRVQFQVANATDFPDGDYNVVSSFNCLHDVQHADKAAQRIRQSLPDDGILFLAEPMAGRELEDNIDGDGRLMTGCSVLCCTPQGMTDNGLGLGTVVADSRLEGIMKEAGFTSFRRVHDERFTRVFDVRP